MALPTHELTRQISLQPVILSNERTAHGRCNQKQQEPLNYMITCHFIAPQLSIRDNTMELKWSRRLQTILNYVNAISYIYRHHTLIGVGLVYFFVFVKYWTNFTEKYLELEMDIAPHVSACINHKSHGRVNLTFNVVAA